MYEYSEDDSLDVEGLFYSMSDDLFCFAEYRKLEVVPGDTNSVDGSEEQILYKGFLRFLLAITLRFSLNQ